MILSLGTWKLGRRGFEIFAKVPLLVGHRGRATTQGPERARFPGKAQETWGPLPDFSTYNQPPLVSLETRV